MAELCADLRELRGAASELRGGGAGGAGGTPVADGSRSRGEGRRETAYEDVMANIDLQSVELRGDNKFVFTMIAPPAPEGQPRTALARAAGKDQGLTPSGDGVVRVEVPRGAPFLVCAIGDEEGAGWRE